MNDFLFSLLSLLQVYQVNSGRFLCRNKYYGRKLSVDGFKEAICQFLHNGKRLRTDALIPLVEKLEDLKQVLLTLDTFRFYTSSLLLVYEGLDPDFIVEEDSSLSASEPDSSSMDCDDCSPEEDSGSGLCSRKIFTNKTDHPSSSGFSKKSPLGPTSFLGMIPCSKSEDEICSNTRRSSSSGGDLSSHHPSLGNCRASGSGNYYSMEVGSSGGAGGFSSSSAASSTGATVGSSQSSKSSLSSEAVDVRMIDFAHATHSGLDLGHCSTEHAGPDTGYIFGLSNLIKVLKGIIQEQMEMC